MKNIKGYTSICPIIILLILFLTACDNSDESFSGLPAQPTAGNSKIEIRLTDAPGDYDEVNLEVVDVLIKSNLDPSDDGGWVSIGVATEPVMYNIMSLTGGFSALVADTLIPSGRLGQIRLLLGENNTIVKNGVTYPLNTPSADQSGLKLVVDELLEPNTSYDFTLDFDVDKSIVKAGNSGNFNLNPVIRVFATVSLGSITGTVTPLGYKVKASVMFNNSEISAYVNEQGVYQINGIPAGMYDVKFTPDPLSGYIEVTIPDIIVSDGKTTNAGNTILLPSQ
ncbi:DUF4382 domain-containing protein [Flavobacterium gilvum]|uniref:DUF4382 domain-containing protein n=1 Tax=Flavobacterium gilvum TaxID=1492737 RepID=A0AAC9I1G1_9FLAO|nr:DUF4382 domain-containing protein [Flavobacterium gilvum]AOW08634.1 hypothetical protein EM308_03480 [Flavobacterium gilvum]KFC59732.1 hypothetical protein FEM08_15130 [Flavobacterium gilvum]